MKAKEIVLYAINGVLLIAVVVLFVLVLQGRKSTPVETSIPEGEKLPLAYVNMDSLLVQYDLYNTLNEDLINEYEKSRATLQKKVNDFQKDAADFQQKVENRAFLSEARARSEQERLMKKQEELQQLDAKLSADFQKKQDALSAKLAHVVDSVVVEYNKEKGFQMIISNSGHAPLLYADKAFDVTKEVLERLNASSAEEEE